MASEFTDVELLGSAWPQKGTTPLGWTVWRLFLCVLIFIYFIYYFFLWKEFLSQSVAIRSQKPHGLAGRKDNGGKV